MQTGKRPFMIQSRTAFFNSPAVKTPSGLLIQSKQPAPSVNMADLAKNLSNTRSNLIQECAARGVHLFFLNARGECTAVLNGIRSHGVGATRRKQVLFLENTTASAELAMRITYGKIRNQRAVLCYFAKSEGFRKQGIALQMRSAIDTLQTCAANAAETVKTGTDCRATLMGIEGIAAATYWKAWIDADIMPNTFLSREGRAGKDITNSALNYGYAILASRVWNAVLIAGLEPYLGFYHVERPGKPSLILDLMEEYRGWCVDRVVIKNRTLLNDGEMLTPLIKKRIIHEVEATFANTYAYHGRSLSLDSILQRQVYRLVGHFSGKKIYKPYLFKW
jgi:CRISPR-associated protein Cas1